MGRLSLAGFVKDSSDSAVRRLESLFGSRIEDLFRLPVDYSG
jgi:hypothetical protein